METIVVDKVYEDIILATLCNPCLSKVKDYLIQNNLNSILDVPAEEVICYNCAEMIVEKAKQEGIEI